MGWEWFEHRNTKAVVDILGAGGVLSGEGSAFVCDCVEENEGCDGGWRAAEEEEGRRGKQGSI